MYFFIIPSEPVNAQYAKQIARFKLFHKLSVLRPVEILSGLLIGINKAVIYTKFVQCYNLPVIILVCARNTNVTVSLIFYIDYLLLGNKKELHVSMKSS